ncbi:MAG TPA: hypothetical protein VEX68_26835 [Bryobacteraceae bacterium]|nr:hypothetical protein [Bryobacteraceae bacterium]
MKPLTLATILMTVLFLLPGCSRKAASADVEGDRNRQFTESMAGVTLVGYSTRLNREGLSKEERYRIDKISHITGDSWLFHTRLQYDGRDIPVPIPLTVKWAGDTPVITLTDLSIPGVGSYTARVVLYRDQYAGTWSGKNNVGGQLFGKIVRQ